MVFRTHSLTSAPHKVVGCVAHKGIGLWEGLEWVWNVSKEKAAKNNNSSEKNEKPNNNVQPEKTLLEQWLEVEDEPDDEFLEKFVTYKLNSWDHRTHLRIAWTYLSKYPRREALKVFLRNCNRNVLFFLSKIEFRKCSLVHFRWNSEFHCEFNHIEVGNSLFFLFVVT